MIGREAVPGPGITEGIEVAAARRRTPERTEPAAPPQRTPRWLRLVLGVPLVVKLGGATLLVGLGLLALVAQQTAGAAPDRFVMALGVALVLLLIVNLYLVSLALRPLTAIEQTADRVRRGDLEARVVPSPLADRDMARLGGTLNLLLDRLLDERQQLRAMARRISDAQDEERARIARELHDSTAQTLTALTLQLTALTRGLDDPAALDQADLVRSLAQTALEEVRTLAVTIYPQVLDDLGLPAALEWLARQTRESPGLDVTVTAETGGRTLSRPAGAALYRVAQEAVRNAQRHARAQRVTLSLYIVAGDAALEVRDDGVGFELAEAVARRPGMGLFAMRDRIELVGGTLAVTSSATAGTLVRATVPLDHAGER